MSEVRVDFASLNAGSESIMVSYRALQSSLDSLESQLAPMVASWSGEAQQAYFAQKAKWEQASAAMAQILAQMGQAVQDAHTNYTAAERSNANMWA